MKRPSYKPFVLLSFIFVSVAACQVPRVHPVVDRWVDQILRQVGGWIGQKTTPVSAPGADSSEMFNRAAHSELLQEVYRGVWMRAPSDSDEYVGLLDALLQGASLEGIYNGFTHSDRYRELEKSQKGASVRALKIFSTELARLSGELPEPIHFAARAAEPLPVPVEPEFVTEAAPRTAAASVGARSVGDVPLAEEYARVFVGASLFTLKRVLGDLALTVIHHKEKDLERLADWYSKWAVQMATYKVDFGLQLRNQPDLSLHYQWATAASVDRLSWEVLNRLHRLLNAAQ